jgi:hypothetical protein
MHSSNILLICSPYSARYNSLFFKPSVQNICADGSLCNALTPTTMTNTQQRIEYPLSGPPSWAMASTKRLWRSEVHLRRCFPLPTGLAGLLMLAPLIAPILLACSLFWALCGAKGTEKFLAWYIMWTLQRLKWDVIHIRPSIERETRILSYIKIPSVYMSSNISSWC